jgi:hypothetical protein
MEARVGDRHGRRVGWPAFLRPRRRPRQEDVYQVSYETFDGDGRVTLRTRGAPTASLAARAADLLQQEGIDGRIRWIAPLSGVPARARGGIAVRARALRAQRTVRS